MYLRLGGAEQLRFKDGTNVRTPQEYLAWQASVLVEKGIARPHSYEGRGVNARVNHGRWILDCKNCRSAMLTSPEWRLGCCVECGTVYPSVEFPNDYRTIEKVLIQRPDREKQNWHPGETIRQLVLENRKHGVLAILED